MNRAIAVTYLLQLIAAILWLTVMADDTETLMWPIWIGCAAGAIVLGMAAGWQIARRAASVRQSVITCLFGPSLVLVGLLVIYGREGATARGAAGMIVAILHALLLSIAMFSPLFIVVAAKHSFARSH